MALLKRATTVCVLLDIDELATGRCPKRRRVVSTEEYESTRTLCKGGFGVVVQERHRDSVEAIAVKALRECAGVKKPYAAAVDEILERPGCGLLWPPLPRRAPGHRTPSPTGELSFVMEYVGRASHHDALDAVKICDLGLIEKFIASV